MLKYTIKRLLQSVVTVLIVVSIVFLLMRMLPTDYYFTEDQLMKFTDQQKTEQLLRAGLLDPPLEQLGNFYRQLFLHLDLGESRRIQSGVAVTKVIGDKMGISMKLGLIALGISLVLGVILGIAQTRFKDGFIDGLGTVYIVFVQSVPHLVSYSLILVFGSQVLGFPPLYSTRNAMSITLPIVCLSLSSIAGYALWTRRYMVDEINKDYIKLARAKGLSMKQIMVKHVLRNAFVPLAQYLPASLLLTIGGSLLVERFFSVPGMGSLMTDAIQRYDTNVVQGCVALYALLGILGVFLGDILMMLIDPRIKLTGNGGTR